MSRACVAIIAVLVLMMGACGSTAPDAAAAESLTYGFFDASVSPLDVDNTWSDMFPEGHSNSEMYTLTDDAAVNSKDVLVINTVDATTDKLAFERSLEAANGSDTIFMEGRIRLDDETTDSQYSAGCYIAADNDEKSVSLGIRDGELVLTFAQQVTTVSNSTGFHTYKIVLQTNGTVDVYMDGNIVFNDVTMGSSIYGGRKIAWFGDGNSLMGAKCTFDYVVYCVSSTGTDCL